MLNEKRTESAAVFERKKVNFSKMVEIRNDGLAGKLIHKNNTISHD